LAIVYLVRHGKAAASWEEEWDPGLNGIGREQAKQVAKTLKPLGPMDIISSPLVRARETAAPLSRAWNKPPRIEDRIGEIPSPGMALENRSRWLIELMGKSWPDLDPALREWRRQVISAMLDLDRDTVAFSHYIAINAVVGEASGDGSVICFSPTNCSVTSIEVNNGKMSLVELGNSAVTEVM